MSAAYRKYRCLECGGGPTPRRGARMPYKVPDDYGCYRHPSAGLVKWTDQFEWAWFYMADAYRHGAETNEAIEEFIATYKQPDYTGVAPGTMAIVWEYLKGWPEHWPPKALPEVPADTLYGRKKLA